MRSVRLCKRRARARGVTLRAVDPRNVRLACSGLLDERAGSVAGAGYLLVRELLARGIDIDFYAENGYTPMPESLAGPRFNYVGIERPRWMSLMSPRAFFLTIWLFAPVVQRSWENLFGPVARERHRAAPYDAVLSLGAALRFTIPGVPTITWLQGAPRTEAAAIRRLRSQIVADRGLVDYYALLAYYLPRRFYDRSLLSSSDALICGSSWTRSMLVQLGIAADKITALPYPVDLRRFVPPNKESVDWSQPEIVWLGRIVPRKRLDLLVDAMPTVATRFPGARLRVVGAPGFGAGELQLAPGFAGARSDHLRAKGGPRERAGAPPESGGGRSDERVRELRQRDRGGTGVWCAGGSRSHERHRRLHRRDVNGVRPIHPRIGRGGHHIDARDPQTFPGCRPPQRTGERRALVCSIDHRRPSARRHCRSQLGSKLVASHR